MMAWNQMLLKYWVHHGDNSGIVKVQRDADKVTLEVGSYKMIVWLLHVYKLEVFKNNVPMWTYQFNKEVDMNPGTYELTLTSEMTLNPDSELHRFLTTSPTGAFQRRTNKLKIFVDKNNRSLTFPKFTIDCEIERDGFRFVDIKLLHPSTTSVRVFPSCLS